MNNKLTIGIATYNSAEVIETCLKSIEDSYPKSLRVIVADNNSTDATHEIISTKFPDVEVFNSGANFGFGYSVNSIVSHSNTQYVLIMNADIEINTETVAPLIEALDKDDDAIIAAPITFDANGNLEGNIRLFPNLRIQTCESLLGGGIARKLRQSETVNNKDEYLTSKKVEWLKGAIWCINKEKFTQLGGMRTDFFLYSEEVELAKRAYDSGMNSILVAESRATHLGGESDTNKLLYTLLTLNKLKYVKIQGSKISFHLMRKVLILGMLLRVKNSQSRYALKSLIRSCIGFEKERARIIQQLNGETPDPSNL